jgi:hypothetical protein
MACSKVNFTFLQYTFYYCLLIYGLFKGMGANNSMVFSEYWLGRGVDEVGAGNLY